LEILLKAAYKAELINIAEYLNTNCIQDQMVNTVTSHKNTQPNMHLTLRTEPNITEELS
jgi:hypothetical protein